MKGERMLCINANEHVRIDPVNAAREAPNTSIGMACRLFTTTRQANRLGAKPATAKGVEERNGTTPVRMSTGVPIQHILILDAIGSPPPRIPRKASQPPQKPPR